MKIDQFDKTNVQAFQKDLSDCLASLCLKYNITLTKHHARFDKNTVKLTLVVETANAPTELDKFAANLSKYHPKLVGATFKLSPTSNTYKVIGYNPRKKYTPILTVIVENNKKYWTAEGLVYSKTGIKRWDIKKVS